MALEGKIENYVGPLPNISSEKTLDVYRNIIESKNIYKLERINFLQKHIIGDDYKNPDPTLYFNHEV